MSNSGESTRDLLARRYGTAPGRPRWVTATVVGVLCAVALAWLGWTAWDHSTPEVRGELSGYTVTSDHEVSVVIDADRSTSDPIECLVRAVASDHTVVGEQTVTIPAGEAGAIRYEADIATERAATSVSVTQCRLVD